MPAEVFARGRSCDSTSFPSESWTAADSLITCSDFDHVSSILQKVELSAVIHI